MPIPISPSATNATSSENHPGRLVVEGSYEPLLLRLMAPGLLLYLILFAFTLPSTFSQPLAQRLQILAIEAGMILMLLGLFYFVVKARRQVWVDRDARCIVARLVLGRRCLREVALNFDHIRSIQAGFERQPPFAVAAPKPLWAVQPNGGKVLLFRSLKLEEVEEARRVLLEDMGSTDSDSSNKNT